MKCKDCIYNNYSVMASPCNRCSNHEPGEKPSCFKKAYKDCLSCIHKDTAMAPECDECREEVSRDDLFPGWHPAPNFDEDGKFVYYGKEGI